MKKFLIPVLAIALIAVAGIGVVSANGGMFQDKTAVIEKMAERFNLDVDEVGDFFQEMKAEKQAMMAVKFDERLDGAVANGDITIEQKDAILAKHAEMQVGREASHEEFVNLSSEERHAQMETRHAEMQEWAEDNGLEDYKFFGGKRGMGFHGMKGMGHFAK